MFLEIVSGPTREEIIQAFAEPMEDGSPHSLEFRFKSRVLRLTIRSMAHADDLPDVMHLQGWIMSEHGTRVSKHETSYNFRTKSGNLVFTGVP